MAIRTEYEEWRDELAADQRRHTLARGLLDPTRVAMRQPMLEARAKGTGKRAQRARRILRAQSEAGHGG